VQITLFLVCVCGPVYHQDPNNVNHHAHSTVCGVVYHLVHYSANRHAHSLASHHMAIRTSLQYCMLIAPLLTKNYIVLFKMLL
jgi:hypothetical protein